MEWCFPNLDIFNGKRISQEIKEARAVRFNNTAYLDTLKLKVSHAINIAFLSFRHTMPG